MSPSGATIHRRTLGIGSTVTTANLFATHANDNFNAGGQVGLGSAATYVASTTAPTSVGAVGSYTINKPAGVLAGDLIVVSLLIIDGSVTSAPSDLTQGHLENSTRWQWYLFTKTATGSDPSSWSFTLSSNWWASLVAAVYRGPTGIGPFNFLCGSGPVGIDPGNGPIQAPSVTVPRGSTVLALFAAGIFGNSGDTITPPGTVTQRAQANNRYSNQSWTDFTA